MNLRWLVVPLLFLSSCESQESYERRQKSHEQLHQENVDAAKAEQLRYNAAITESQASKQVRRQRMIDESSIVCRDGTAYLVGDSMESWKDGGIFAVPYIVDGVIGGCQGHKGQRISSKPPEKPQEPKVTF